VQRDILWHNILRSFFVPCIQKAIKPWLQNFLIPPKPEQQKPKQPTPVQKSAKTMKINRESKFVNSRKGSVHVATFIGLFLATLLIVAVFLPDRKVTVADKSAPAPEAVVGYPDPPGFPKDTDEFPEQTGPAAIKTISVAP
jgi:hypothetical protein